MKKQPLVEVKRLGILHITDLHSGFKLLPEGEKQSSVSPKLEAQLEFRDPRTLFLRKVLQLLDKQPVHLLAFTGDIGWGKATETMEEGILYLSKLKGRLNLDGKNVILVPGNHDLEREAEGDNEFKKFITACRTQGFTYTEGLKPAFVKVMDIPIIALNTCLGGTEQAFYGLPSAFWSAVQEAVNTIGDLSEENGIEIPATMKLQLKAMDIPAVGNSQIDDVEAYLQTAIGNFAIVLGHHNPLPTHMTVIRPYAELVDSGQLVFSLIGNSRRILFLHGHTHCDSVLVAQSPEEDNTGFIACIGGCGLNEIPGGGSPSASYIQVLADSNSNFLAAIVKRFHQKGANFLEKKAFYVLDIPTETENPLVQINELEPRKSLFFDELLAKFSTISPDSLAIELLKHTRYRQLEILGIEGPFKNWRITRNP